jgi:pilus assembly protein Flp/PilA
MPRVRAFVGGRQARDEGASSVEYGLLVAAIAALIFVVVWALGGWTKGSFRQTCDRFSQNAASLTTTQDATCGS